MSAVLNKNSSAYIKCVEALAKQLQEAIDMFDENPDKETVNVTLTIPLSRRVAEAMSTK